MKCAITCTILTPTSFSLIQDIVYMAAKKQTTEVPQFSLYGESTGNSKADYTIGILHGTAIQDYFRYFF